MKVIHKGKTPTYDLEPTEMYKDMMYEPYPNGGGKFWSPRELKTGCGGDVMEPYGTVATMEDYGLIYCPYCDEWFNEKEFEYNE